MAMNVGIDRISFYTPQYYLDLRTLAQERGVDPDKYLIGLGQERMSVPPPDEDIISMAASAAWPILEATGRDGIELLLFATESAIDQSKSAATFLHGLLELPARCRAVELKQACYAATAGLRLAAELIARRPEVRALVVGSDIARYDLQSAGEPTQGAGAVAMLVTAEPRILVLEPEYGVFAQNVFDFWRPNYREEALVDGKYSMRVYITALEHCWQDYVARSGRRFEDIARFCYHLPFTRMAEKAHIQLAKSAGLRDLAPQDLDRHIGDSLCYNRVTGNTYAASLYEGLVSLLDNCAEDLGGARIGLFSYGSGCVGEFFSGIVQPGYREHLFTERHKALLADRIPLTYRQYEDIFLLPFPTDGGDHRFARYKTGPFRLAGVCEHKRVYERVT